MNFGQAIEKMKSGKMVRRSGWNGKNMSVYIHTFVHQEPCIIMNTAQRTSQPGWLASQADMLSDDWEITDGVHRENPPPTGEKED